MMYLTASSTSCGSVSANSRRRNSINICCSRNEPRRRNRSANPASWSGGVLTMNAVNIQLTYLVKSFASSSARSASQSSAIASGGCRERLSGTSGCYRLSKQSEYTYPRLVRNRLKWSISSTCSTKDGSPLRNADRLCSTRVLRSIRCFRHASKALR
jgi:hypothetical protein